MCDVRAQSGQVAIAHNTHMHRRGTIAEALMNVSTASVREHEAWVGAVRRCVLLAHLPEAELNFVRQSARKIQTKESDTLFKQGDSTVQVHSLASPRQACRHHLTFAHPILAFTPPSPPSW